MSTPGSMHTKEDRFYFSRTEKELSLVKAKAWEESWLGVSVSVLPWRAEREDSSS